MTVVDKAAMDRSGAVAMGLSAINQYIGYGEGDNTLEDYVKYVRQDLMGISVKTWFMISPATWTLPFTSSRNGASPSGKTTTASTCMKAAGRS